MNNLFKSFLKFTFATFLLGAYFIVGNIHASETDEANLLRFYKGGNKSYLQATLQADFAVFNQKDSWFGNSKGVLQGQDTSFWWESLVRPGIEGRFTLSNYQKLYARLDAVQANTGSEIDANGTNGGLGAVSYRRVENAYAGWRSGQLFSSLGEDFLDFSFGRQQYMTGNGFLFSSQGGSGFNRAAWYLGGRRSAEYAGIVRMKTGGWTGDLLYLKADDIADTNTRAGGATMNYAIEQLVNFGGGLYSINSEDPNRPARDSMKVYDIRGGIKPFEMGGGLPVLIPLKFEAEYVYEDTAAGFSDGYGWYLAASYQFDTIPWQPCLTYRYASFSEQYDPLFYGATDWGSWFQGEIIGEFVLLNTNLDSNMIKLKVQPFDPVIINLIYYHFMLHNPATIGVTSKDYADEVDVTIDWAVNTHLTLSLVGAYALPGDAAVQHLGGSENWSYMMLAGCVKF